MADGRTVVKLYDFGLAAVASTKLHGACGSPSFMAPEMIRGSGYEPADFAHIISRPRSKRNCADTTGTVPVPWAGQFQC